MASCYVYAPRGRTNILLAIQIGCLDAQGNLANSLQQAGRHDEAESIQRKIVSIVGPASRSLVV